MSEFSLVVGVWKLVMIFVNEANEDLDVLGVYIYYFVDLSSLNVIVGVVDISCGMWLLC